MTEQGDEYPSAAIIILNWNGWENTVECLESVYQIDYPNYEVIVVDNGSEDNSIEKIKKYAKGEIAPESDYFEYRTDNKPIEIFEVTKEESEKKCSYPNRFEDYPSDRKMILLKNERNYGFAEGNNVAIRYALNAMNPDYFLLLNNDTVVDRNFLSEQIRISEKDKRIGITGSKIYHYDFKGRKDVIDYAGERKSSVLKVTRYGAGEIDTGQHERIRRIDKVDGSSMLIKRRVLDEIGFFDPVFFTYYEDDDLCYRAKKAGYKLIYVPRAEIWHKRGSSTVRDIEEKVSLHKAYYGIRNRIIFFWKHKRKFNFWGYLLYLFVFKIWKSVIYYLFKHKNLGASISFLKGMKKGLELTLRGK